MTLDELLDGLESSTRKQRKSLVLEYIRMHEPISWEQASEYTEELGRKYHKMTLQYWRSINRLETVESHGKGFRTTRYLVKKAMNK